MYCVSVTFEIRLEEFDRFLARIGKHSADCLALEPGCRAFEVWTDSTRPGQVHLHEVYDDLAAFEAHGRTAHMADCRATIAPMIVGRNLVTWDGARP
ncbi:quinol monooxygenase YgiN [Hoeflea marina]|uniref:Quinol monooxygenase YgiN n=1 Tax=Hoeflea marina TaxID=274592 RepID=A0A317PJG2_9HYPH|nr:putative quinol monooxygenase [Hoeflea marina]PWW00026.1 quinol monooxygenase YgiN [Hoeflea marina]